MNETEKLRLFASAWTILCARPGDNLVNSAKRVVAERGAPRRAPRGRSPGVAGRTRDVRRRAGGVREGLGDGRQLKDERPGFPSRHPTVRRER